VVPQAGKRRKGGVRGQDGGQGPQAGPRFWPRLTPEWKLDMEQKKNISLARSDPQKRLPQK
jgi:hypothetical protein